MLAAPQPSALPKGPKWTVLTIAKIPGPSPTARWRPDYCAAGNSALCRRRGKGGWNGGRLPIPALPMKTVGQELRFTRSRQAVGFWLGGLMLWLVAAGLAILSWWQLDGPPPWWLALVPFFLGVGALALAGRLTRHAYLLLSPVGVEIFPFWKPVDNFQLLPWGTIAAADFSLDGRWLHLTLGGYEDVKVILTLDPLPRPARQLLRQAVEGVMAQRAPGAGAAASSDS